MEEMSEFAGNLKAELLTARNEFYAGHLAERDYLNRIEVIRRRAESGRTRKPQHVLIFESATEAMDSLSGGRR